MVIIIKEFCNALRLTQKLHCPYHPQRSGNVERTDSILKFKLTKLSEMCAITWPKVIPLPLAFMAIWSIPLGTHHTSHQLLPYELATGRPKHLGISPLIIVSVLLHTDMRKYCRDSCTIPCPITKIILPLFPQHLPKQPLCDLRPGDFSYWKRYKRQTVLEPHW